MADSDLTFAGLYYLRGKVVSCAIAGLDMGDFTVASDGTITVPFESNPNLTLDFIAQVSGRGLDAPNLCALVLGDQLYTVPVVIGRAYTSKGQMFRTLTQEGVKSPSGGGLGKLRRGHQYSFLFVSSGPCAVGTDFTSMYDTHLKGADNTTDWPGVVGFSGVHREALLGGTNFDTLLSWTCDRPVPCTIAAAAVHQEVEEVE